VKAGEAAGEPPAAEKVPELLLDEPGQACSVSQTGGLRAKRLEVIAHDLLQHALCGIPRLVAPGPSAHARRDAGGVPEEKSAEPA
jgi:hypothetical protein